MVVINWYVVRTDSSGVGDEQERVNHVSEV